MAPKKGVKIATKQKTEKWSFATKEGCHRFVRWPQVERKKRKRRILKQRLKRTPPSPSSSS
ncbi:ribosomal protein L7Ae/L30e/S12e/Gadd45 family protein [Artemisia annua]|uniref:Ribosomal protein L7Ae/L30e/S12e/Gadd45 family protein n=1 Tax=Artemisia annua TaxID=35608 RepID=A0A2U1N1Z9_ARTAN|nr:ribosomal protein L7Ae/L30e/S12e/Gadd45 family protein [Artemisia annua]